MKEKIIYSETVQPAKDKRSISLLAALSLAFNFGLFSPMDFYLNNISEIGLSYRTVMLACLPVAVLLFTAVYLTLRLTKGKAHIIALSVTVGLDLAFYVQGNYMTQGMQILDGAEYYVHPVRAVLDILMWAAIIALPFIVWKKKRESFRLMVLLISGAVIVIEIAALIFTAVRIMTGNSYGLRNVIIEQNTNTFDLHNEFTYSDKKNLIIVIADEYDSFAFDWAVNEVPDSISGFDGFTYYNNTVGMYQYTYDAAQNIFTGRQTDYGKSLTENFYDGCFFDHIPEEYTVEFYTDSVLVPLEVKKKYADNYVKRETTFEDILCVGRVIYDMTLYKTLPDVVKRPFWMYSGDLSNELSSGGIYHFDNLSFYHSLPSNLNHTEKPLVKLIYLHGLHNPRDVDRNLNKLESTVEPQETAIAVNKILSEYMELLRRGGVYDNSDIIVMADHGHIPNYGAKYPLLLIKRAGETGEGLKVSSAPISYNDICPTLRYLVGDDTVTERTVFDIREGEQRERLFAALGETITGNVDRSLPLIVSKNQLENEVVKMNKKEP